MSRTKRYLLIAAIGLTAFVAACVVMFLIARRDEPPPDVSDLLVERTDINPDENAYTYLVAAGRLATEPNFSEPLDYLDWPHDVVDKAVADNAAAFEQLDKAMACPQIQAPPVGDWTTDLQGIFYHLPLARLTCLRASDRFRKGQEAEAMDDAARLLHLAGRLDTKKGGLANLLVSNSVRGMAVERLRMFAERSQHLDAGHLKALAADIGACPMRQEDLAKTLKSDYEMTANTIDAIAQGRITGNKLPYLTGTGLDRGLTGPYWLKPNATKRLFAEATRAELAALTLPWPESQAALKEKRAEITSKSQGFQPWSYLPLANRTGMLIYYRDAFADAANLPKMFAASLNEQAMTQLLVALKAYKVDSGRLPEKIEDLVPEYLQALPLDTFDGKPLRYSRDKKIVYSVGPDGQDSGGMTQEEIRAWAKEHAVNYHVEEYPDNLPPLWALPNPSLPIKF